MTINCIKERVTILKKLWNREHDEKTMKILLDQLNNDIVLFLDEKLPKDIDKEIEELNEEINRGKIKEPKNGMELFKNKDGKYITRDSYWTFGGLHDFEY